MSCVCDCDFCIDQYFDFHNNNIPCPKYRPPDIDLENTLSKCCPICYDVVVILVQTNTCKHEFCQNCLLTWKRNFKRGRKPTCPICRVNL